jgi:hypothetical protein
MTDTAALRRQFSATNKRLRRARRLYCWLAYRAVFDGTINANANVKLHWRVLYMLAARARTAGLYAPTTSLRDVAFSIASHFHRFDGRPGWHQWWGANLAGNIHRQPKRNNADYWQTEYKRVLGP